MHLPAGFLAEDTVRVLLATTRRLSIVSAYETQNPLYIRISFSKTTYSGRKPISGRFPVRFDSFHRQNVQNLARLPCRRELYTCLFPSRLSKLECSGVNPFETFSISSE
jgi:hypothetical protein